MSTGAIGEGRGLCGLVFTTDRDLHGGLEWQEAMGCLECRGPDSKGEFNFDVFAAGHTRLEIIGLGDPGAQPLVGHEGDLLIYNGEIYNFREIGATLGIEPISDTQVLHELLRRGRFDLLGHLRGMYAFVFWCRSTQTVLAGRDPFGIKPLYVFQTDDGELSFASTAGALAHLHGLDAFDPVAVTGFLASGFFLEDNSAFSGIRKLPSGLLSRWTRVGGRWAMRDEPIEFVAEQSSIQSAMRESVADHMVADVPVGVLMSGGVDSTLLAILACQHVDELRTFTVTNPQNASIDEAAFAAWNAKVLGTTHTEVPVTSSTLVGQCRGLLRTSGEPFGDAAYLPLAAVCERASQDVKVVLAGEGADELFGGYKRYEIERRFLGISHRSQRWSTATMSMAMYKRLRPHQVGRTLTAGGLDPGLLRVSFMRGGEWPTVLETTGEWGSLAWRLAEDAWNSDSKSLGYGDLPEFRKFDIGTWLPNVYLEKSDRASMLHGLEVRVPFLDARVLRAALAYDPEDSRKVPLRDAITEMAPQVRLPERKRGLAVALQELLETPELAEALRYELSGSGVIGQLTGGQLKRFAKRCARSPDLSFRVAVLGLWADVWSISRVDSSFYS